MSRKSELPQSRRHVFVFDEDWEYLYEAYGPGSKSKMGVSNAIRKIIHTWVVHLKNEQTKLKDSRQRELL